jgi:peptidoglycan/xylan/chitin deacetylase (PgdA/CDA1 family)
VLDLLASYGVRATFCVVGERVEAPGGAALLRRTVAEGHALANHGTSYDDLGDWSRDRVATDLAANLRTIRIALGDPTHPVPWFRAANGSWGVSREVARDLGMAPLELGTVIHDWDGCDLRPATVLAHLRSAVRPGAVVLLHDGGGDRSATIAALATVLPDALAAGVTFGRPDALAAS